MNKKENKGNKQSEEEKTMNKTKQNKTNKHQQTTTAT